MIRRDEHVFDPVPDFTPADDQEAVESEFDDQLEQPSEFRRALEENDLTRALLIARAKRRGVE